MGGRPWLRSWVTIAVFFVAWLWLSWPWLSGAVTIPYDAKALFQAELQFLANAVHQGQWPFWSPYAFGGVPQVADPQSLIFSPMAVLAVLTPYPDFRALDAFVLGLLALGGGALLMFFRDRGWHPAGAVVAAMAYAFGASAAWRIQHVGQIESYALFAVALWLIARTLDRASWRCGIAAGLAIGLMVVKPDQVAFLAMLVLAGFVIDRWLARPSLDQAVRATAGPLLAASAIGLVIAAVPLMLTFLFAVSSDRAEIAFEDAVRGSLHPASLLTAWVGDLYGARHPAVEYWGPYSTVWDPNELTLSQNMGQIYVGALPIAAVLGIGLARGVALARDVRFFSLAALFSILYALGHYTPVFPILFDTLPGVGAFRRPADATFMIGALLSIPAGYFVHRLVGGALPRLRLAHWLLAGLLILGGFGLSLGVAIGAGRLDVALRPIVEAAAWIALALLMLAALAALRRRAAFALVTAATLFMAADLGRNNGPNESTALPPGQFDVLDPNTHDETIRLLKKLLREPLPSARRDRIELLGIGFEWPNVGLVHGFEHTLGYNPLRLAEFAEAVGARDNIAGPDQRTFTPLFPSYRSLLADMLGLRFILSGVPIEQVDSNLKPGDLNLVVRTGYGFLYENPRALPRVLFATDWRRTDFDALMEDGRWPEFDPRRTVLLDSEPEPPWSPDADCARSTVSLTGYRNTVIEINVEAACRGFVVLNDIWHPWWSATLDDEPVDILRANVLFRAVQVPPGRHTLRFEFNAVAGAVAEATERLHDALLGSSSDN
jgi:hypothetical protein